MSETSAIAESSDSILFLPLHCGLSGRCFFSLLRLVSPSRRQVLRSSDRWFFLLSRPRGKDRSLQRNCMESRIATSPGPWMPIVEICFPGTDVSRIHFCRKRCLGVLKRLLNYFQEFSRWPKWLINGQLIQIRELFTRPEKTRTFAGRITHRAYPEGF